MKKNLLAIGISYSIFAQFTTSGNVTSANNIIGIGTLGPSYTLDVLENIRSTGNITTSPVNGIQ